MVTRATVYAVRTASYNCRVPGKTEIGNLTFLHCQFSYRRARVSEGNSPKRSP
ncbi:hypothetical protein SuNHUV7_14420 (plasmid) [Pseudoseohaeicola sp. NH-UV-7]